ncbi:MAG: DNA polymerase III subunit alpha [Candidatus Gastranaerophilales bacterium]|nr:DNA polymerase III subunit alpha [Candidatus Gastranaerophilales bacterium]
MSYVPLHLHTEYSLLDGAIKVKKLCKFCKEQGWPAVAITDHGVMHGAIELYKTAREMGIKALIGMEAYVYHGDITEKKVGQNELFHLILIAKNNTGYKNLVKIASKSAVDGFYYKPRSNHELIEKYSEGLICLSACIQGEVARSLINDDYEKAFEFAKYYQSIFGEDYYIELQDHGLPEEEKANNGLLKIAKELNIKTVITNDSHYMEKEDASWHDTLLCLNTNADKANKEKRYCFPNDEFYVKTPEELRQAFTKLDDETFEQSIKNTVEVAEKCNVIIELGKSKLPHFPVPPSYTIETYLDFKVREGLKKRYGNVTKEIKERADYELGVINKMGFPAYFLITWDFINYAKEHDIPVGPGRGSAAGSIVAYALGITDIDPIFHKLMFERFLNPERVSMPDIDIDFCIEGREKVFQYVVEKYGADKVCQIITFGTLAAKEAVKSVARTLNVPFDVSNNITKLIPATPGILLNDDGKHLCAFNESPEFQEFYDKDEPIQGDSLTPGVPLTAKQIIDEAMHIEGIKRNTGMHAAGVIISQVPLDDLVPLQRGKEGNLITQYEKQTSEDLGLLKMDFLGLLNLTIMRNALRLIKKRHGIDLELNKIPLDDKPTFDLLQKGDTDGVFQLESAGMKKLVRDLKPSVFEDLGALVAIFRPGPLGTGMDKTFVARKHGREPITYEHPLLEPILKDTYGTILYQEQIMKIVQDLGGFTLGQADMMRRAMGKKKKEIVEASKGEFIGGCVKNGVDKKIADDLFEKMLKFAEYCFNRAHSAAYAFVAYQTAYLKAHYPVEYFSALLSSVKDNKEKTQMYIAMAQGRGIEVLPPDINKSDAEFTPDGDKIRFGLNSLKGVGLQICEMVEEERAKSGEFKSLYDFITRMNTKCINKKTLESLIRTGSLSCLEPCRKKLFNNIDNMINVSSRENKAKELGQVSLFSVLGDSNPIAENFELYGSDEEYSDKEIQEFEKEYLGFYITSHPLDSVRKLIPYITTNNICDFEDLQDFQGEKEVTVCGMINSIRMIPTKKDPTKFLKSGVIEDLTGKIEFVAFHKTLEECGSLIDKDKKLIIKGKFQKRDEGAGQIIIESARAIDNSNTVTLTINREMSFEEIMNLKHFISQNQGSDPLLFKVKTPNDTKDVKIISGAQAWVNANNDFIQKLEKNYKDTLSVEVVAMT